MTVDWAPLRAFLAEPARNRYIRLGHLKAYVRKGHHVISFKYALTSTLDLANIEAPPRWRGRGQFRALIPLLRAELLANPDAATINGIYVENVHNPRLVEALPTMGFHVVPRPDEGVPSFYLPIR